MSASQSPAKCRKTHSSPEIGTQPRQQVAGVTLQSCGLYHVLPRGILQQAETSTSFPPRPEQLPAHLPEGLVADKLQNLNGHMLDRQLSFHAEEHEYFWQGRPVTTSVTQLIKEVVEPFQEEEAIKSLQSSRNWPRAGYLKFDCAEHLLPLLHQMPNAKLLAAELTREQPDEEVICQLAWQLRAQAAGNPREEAATAAVLRELCLSEEEIRQKWAKAREEGSREGTWMHAQFECLLNGGSVPEKTEEVQLLMKFLTAEPDMVAYRTEWRVYAHEEDIAGSIDYVAERADGSKVIVDWKRTKNMRLKGRAFGKVMRTPLNHVPDCAVWQYRLQLNVYRFILEKYYGQRISAMYIVGTHPDNGQEPWVDKVPVMETETQALVASVAVEQSRARCC